MQPTKLNTSFELLNSLFFDIDLAIFKAALYNLSFVILAVTIAFNFVSFGPLEINLNFSPALNVVLAEPSVWCNRFDIYSY